MDEESKARYVAKPFSPSIQSWVVTLERGDRMGGQGVKHDQARAEGAEQSAAMPQSPVLDSLVWCAMGATEDGSATCAGAASSTLGKRKERRCMP